MTTPDNNNQQLESPLGEREMLAVEMRYEGYNNAEIAAAIAERFPGSAVQHQTVRAWFMRGGKIRDFYDAYVIDQNKARNSEARGMFTAHVKNAVRTLVHVMNKSKLDFARVQAAKEILARELGEPLKVVVAPGSDPAEKLLEAYGIRIKTTDDKPRTD